MSLESLKSQQSQQPLNRLATQIQKRRLTTQKSLKTLKRLKTWSP